ncbi:type IV toxin-antitoxin system AbiEi family antitoxin domain-containing protein [Peristeroidobacter soli]|uniref:type IV toxin-antitoxin system AbiEi family antitoxin domain-containing protein n=1 Tax=Peristeroidobacter soli TaxID=2497877 RepID=UPI00101CD3A3|nr:type IV toxin-antitoxin system AbiEi family antitoxin domain-containing protein [Peristeroidobacter soli]
MTTTRHTILKTVLARLPAGAPVTSADLTGYGVSPDLAVHYVRAGWLNRLERGVFLRPGDTLSLAPSLLLLERKLTGLHVGGKSALEWHGIRHYVSQQTTLHLYGWVAGRLPAWFTDQFPSDYHRKRLFKEKPETPLHVARFEGLQAGGNPLVSSPERALLELLSEVGVRQPLSEARELTEGTHTLRASALSNLLKHCTSVKTVRLCLTLGRELSSPWVSKLDPKQLPTGSDKPWVSRSSEGTLVLKP